jgi:hypothetical protein
MSSKVSRPFGVTIVFLLILLSGALLVLAGILRLFNRGDEATVTVTQAIVSIVIGVVYLLVAKGIANGSRGARMLVALLTILSVAQGFWVLFTNLSNISVVIAASIQVLIGLAILGILYSRRAGEFFRA